MNGEGYEGRPNGEEGAQKKSSKTRNFGGFPSAGHMTTRNGTLLQLFPRPEIGNRSMFGDWQMVDAKDVAPHFSHCLQ